VSQETSNALGDSHTSSTWNGLYIAGGICAILYVLLALFVPFFMFINHTELSGMVTGKEIIGLILKNGNSWWVTLQTLVLGTSFFAMITFVALFVALKEVDKSRALIGSVLAVSIHILFVAYYPVMLALGFISSAYQTAGEIQQKSFETAAEPLLAINNAFNPLYESVFAISILILSLAMLKGVFDRKVAYLGILTSISAFIALLLFPVVGIGYFWWWLLFMAWFIAVGVKLFLMGIT
jgi:hypothetical protein